jgi:hypothetical protein
MRRATPTDEEGRFTFELSDELSQGELTVRATKGGRAGEASVGSAGSDVVVRLGPAATLHGRVLFPAPGPTGSFTVTTSGDGPFPGFGTDLRFVGDTFDLVDLPPGALEVEVQTDDGRTGTGSVTLTPGEAGQIEIALQPGITLSGRMVDAADAPVPNVFLSLDGALPFTNEPTRTGADGRFQFKNLPPGKHHLEAFAPHQGVLNRDFELSAGANLELGDLAFPAPRGPTVEAPAP